MKPGSRLYSIFPSALLSFACPLPISSLSPFLNPGTMPKERRSRISSDRPSPFPPRSSDRRRLSHGPSSSRNPAISPRPAARDSEEWDEILCTVCMDHPHNAVLLHCSNHKKGCRPFMCNTSCRHSNCLDQYLRAFAASVKKATPGSKPKLSCPLCRGAISGRKVVEAARKHLNNKARNCSKESCGFMGTYREIRKHARKEHPLERDLDDFFCTVLATFREEEEEEEDVVEDFGSWLL